MANMTKAEQIKKIQELGFACVDLNLYLDTHNDDKNALSIYNSLSKEYESAICSYEKKYGPLMNFGHGSSTCPWQWVDEPWPWEKEFYE